MNLFQIGSFQEMAVLIHFDHRMAVLSHVKLSELCCSFVS